MMIHYKWLCGKEKGHLRFLIHMISEISMSYSAAQKDRVRLPVQMKMIKRQLLIN